jgi:hypothetical protein
MCSKHVELILEINKTVIVASSCSSIFTLPTLMMQGQTQITFTRKVIYNVLYFSSWGDPKLELLFTTQDGEFLI